MGDTCSTCDKYQAEMDANIFVSVQKFTQIPPKPQVFEDIQTLADNQLPSTFQNQSFHLKPPDTYFIGSLQNPLQKTFGVLYKPDQTLFYGHFLNGLIDGPGVLKLIRQNLILRGEFTEGKPNGKGELQDITKTFRFHGLWKQSTKPVSGILKFSSNKTIQQIQFLNFQHGDAQIYYRNGSVFKGFIDKKTLLPHGSGKMAYASGDSYEGEWQYGKFQGVGTYIWKKGEKYNGEYRNGLRNGEGSFCYASGNQYKGNWKDGKKEGFGKILTHDGKLIQKGIYHNDIFDAIESENLQKKSMQKVPHEESESQLMNKKDNHMIDRQEPMEWRAVGEFE